MCLKEQPKYFMNYDHLSAVFSGQIIPYLYRKTESVTVLVRTLILHVCCRAVCEVCYKPIKGLVSLPTRAAPPPDSVNKQLFFASMSEQF